MSVFKLHSVKIPHNKNTAECVPQQMPVPQTVVIPMSMHIGAAANPIVKVGDTVKVGQKIAEAAGTVSSPIYASVSGKIKKIDEVLLSNGSTSAAVVIESDGEQQLYDGIVPPQIETFDDFINATAQSGVVGLGGAGFPIHVKLNVKDISKLEYIIINCAECEGYVTADTRTMLDKTDELFDGIKILRHFYGNKKFIIGIENNKSECIKKLTQYCNKNDVQIKVLPSSYPMGGEKVLVYNTTGRIIPEGKLPLDVGAVVLNCTTLTSLREYIRHGVPLTHKTVTIDGSAINEPKNVIVPIGTKIKDVVEFCGGYKKEPKKIIYGGTMMGIAVPDDEAPILKNTNAVLIFDENETNSREITECINCGRCVSHCPMNLMPNAISTAFDAEDADRLFKLKVNLCMECGCCSYVCPAKRPLVQTNKLAKALLRKNP